MGCGTCGSTTHRSVESHQQTEDFSVASCDMNRLENAVEFAARIENLGTEPADVHIQWEVNGIPVVGSVVLVEGSTEESPLTDVDSGAVTFSEIRDDTGPGTFPVTARVVGVFAPGTFTASRGSFR